ncbi:hypothetical protein KC19_10G188000 [Ceratodon purpureus]|uniref:Uncharacterized protein n=1 Tax=Ceratodon purpureus TaxID=3225 RepID=A0A8T0GQQ2_CERPU|nr:hypothetical protein KC19_10G188000 [Ceratodon purpureus]
MGEGAKFQQGFLSHCECRSVKPLVPVGPRDPILVGVAPVPHQFSLHSTSGATPGKVLSPAVSTQGTRHKAGAKLLILPCTLFHHLAAFHSFRTVPSPDLLLLLLLLLHSGHQH